MHVAIADITPAGWRHQGELPLPLADRLGRSLQVAGRPLGGRCELTLKTLLPAKSRSPLAGRLKLTGTLDVAGQLSCSKCLAPAAIALTVPLEVALVPAGTEPAPLPGGELTADAVEQYTYEGEEVALEAVLHDEIIMALPQRLLCSEECRGLCIGCGENLNELATDHECTAKRPSGPLAALANFRPKHPTQQKE